MMNRLLLLLAACAILLPALVIGLYSIALPVPYPGMFPYVFTLSYWENILFHNGLFWDSLFTSLMIGLANGILSCLVGLSAARAIVRHVGGGARWIHIFSALPLFVPAIALFMGSHTVLIRLHLVNTSLGVILAHMLVTIPYAVNVFVVFFETIPVDLEQAARTLGCGTAMLFKRILFPMMTPAIWMAFSMAFLISFSEYFSTFLIGGGRILTLAALMYPFVANGDTGNGSVLGLLFLGINLGVFGLAELLARKRFAWKSPSGTSWSIMGKSPF